MDPDYCTVPLSSVFKKQNSSTVLKQVDKFNLEILSPSDFRKAFFNLLPRKTVMEHNTIFRDYCLFTVAEVLHMVFIIVFACLSRVLKSCDKSAL